MISGFIDAGEACCGTGAYGNSGVCNLLSVCLDPRTFIFWDFAHPSERAYQLVVSSVIQTQRNNDPSFFASSSSSVNTSLSN